MPPYTIDRHQLAQHESSMVMSPCHIPTFASQLTEEYSPSTRHTVRRQALSTCPISLDHGPQSVSPNSLDYYLHVCTIMASNCISKLTRSQPPSVFGSSSIPASKFTWSWPTKHISKFPRVRPPSASSNSLDYGLQVHLQTRSTMASKFNSELNLISASMCISELLALGLQMHLKTCSITASKCISELNNLGLQLHLQTRSITACEFARSCPPSTSTNSVDHDLRVHLDVHSYTAPKCRCKSGRWPCRSASPNPLDHSMGVYLGVHSIVIFRRTSNWSQASPAAHPDSPCVDGLLYRCIVHIWEYKLNI